MDFVVPADLRIKLKESEKKDKYRELVKELKKLWKGLVQEGPGGLGNKWTSRDHPNYSIIEIGLDTEKSPGDLTRHAVSQTPVRIHRLTLLLKTE